jgi:putative heme transporter
VALSCFSAPAGTMAVVGPEEKRGTRMGLSGPLRRLVQVAVAAAAAALVLLVPRSAGTSWAAVTSSVTGLTWTDLGVLALLWAAGLLAHTLVLTASLPGLTTLRALLLNLSGSAVANVLPLGGAAGVGLNFAMVRGWGFTSRSFRTFTAVSNLLTVLAKLFAGALGVFLVLLAGRSTTLPSAVVWTAVGSVATVVPVLVGLAVSARLTTAVGAVADRVVRAVGTLTGSAARTRLRSALPGLRADTHRAVRDRWGRLGAGMGAYLLLQGALLWACLHVLGGSPGVVVVVAALAAERLLTMVPITPAGAGLVEAGTVAVLVALGADAVLATSAVLLYRTFTVVLEIPVGAAGLGLWLLRRRVGAAA